MNDQGLSGDSRILNDLLPAWTDPLAAAQVVLYDGQLPKHISNVFQRDISHVGNMIA